MHRIGIGIVTVLNIVEGSKIVEVSKYIMAELPLDLYIN